MPALEFTKETLFNSASPACLWKHPWQAARVMAGAAQNILLPLTARVLPGGRRECPVCEWRGHRFHNFLSADEIINNCICPECGSFDRHRQLVLGVRAEIGNGGSTPEVMLGFSLSTALRFLLEHEGLARCFRCDVALDDDRFAPDVVSDLRYTPYADVSVDWVFCSHVLEHIAELDLCVDELLRILKPGGLAWLQVPFEPGIAHSRRIDIDPHRAHAHAWQFAPDFGGLIDRDGWTVREIVAAQMLTAEELHRYGVDRRERYWLARKHA